MEIPIMFKSEPFLLFATNSEVCFTTSMCYKSHQMYNTYTSFVCWRMHLLVHIRLHGGRSCAFCKKPHKHAELQMIWNLQAFNHFSCWSRDPENIQAGNGGFVLPVFFLKCNAFLAAWNHIIPAVWWCMVIHCIIVAWWSRTFIQKSEAFRLKSAGTW